MCAYRGMCGNSAEYGILELTIILKWHRSTFFQKGVFIQQNMVQEMFGFLCVYNYTGI